MSDDGAAEDFVNVYVNALKSALLDPEREWTLDAVIEENWGEPCNEEFEGEDPEGKPATAAQWVRGWH